MTQRTSPQVSFSIPTNLSRRTLVAGGAGAAALVGIGAAALMGDGANSLQPGDGTGGSTPPPATPPPRHAHNGPSPRIGRDRVRGC